MKYFLLAISSCIIIRCMCQTDAPLTNNDVIQLYKMGLGDATVISKIKTGKTNFDVSVQGLIALKRDSLPDAIINAMVENASKNTVANAPTNDPLSDHPAGIYYLVPKDTQLLQLLPTLSNESKTNTLGMMFSYGLAKAKTKRSVPGASARMKIKDRQPIFYFYIPENDQGAMAFNASFSATSPNDFVLIQLTPNEKQNEREVVVGSFNAYSSQSGVDNSKTLSFQFEKKKKGIYQVRLDSALLPGEYAFMYANNQVSRVFDFSIQQ